MNRLAIAVVAILFCSLSAIPAAAQANLGGSPGNCDKAAAALPLLNEIRDSPVKNERDEMMQSNAEAAIRILSAPPANR